MGEDRRSTVCMGTTARGEATMAVLANGAPPTIFCPLSFRGLPGPRLKGGAPGSTEVPQCLRLAPVGSP